MRVGLIDPVGGHGGMDYYDYGLAQGLGSIGVEVHYFTSTETNKREFKNVHTYTSFEKVWMAKNKAVKFYYFLKGYIKALKKAKKLRAEIVHLQFFDLDVLNLLVVGLVKLFGFKSILTLHDVSSFKGNSHLAIQKTILKSFDGIIVHNEMSFDELIKKYDFASKVNIIPHGNYLPFIEELPYSKRPSDTLNLLFFGQIKKVKGLEILLEALKELKNRYTNFHLTIAGKPWHDDIETYRCLIDELGISQHVTTVFKFIPDNEVANYFKKTDLVILPYRKIYQSGVLLLAMSYGRVVVTSDLIAFKEVIEDNHTGIIFENKNPKNLANRLKEVIDDNLDLTEIRNNASSLLKNKFDWTKIGNSTLKFYKKMLD